MYLFKGKAKDLLPDIETKMKLNAIQQMLDDTGMLAYELPVTHDEYPENEIIINGVECTYCRETVDAEEIHSFEDVDMCESCYQNMVE